MSLLAVAVRHVAFEDLGILEALLRRRGFSVRYLDAPVESLAAAAEAPVVVVLGGPIGVADAEVFPFLTEEMRLLEGRLGAGLPTLGICLGAQLMARALGASVYPAGSAEIGWTALSLTAAGRASSLRHLAEPPAPVLHWHGDTFDIPAGATHLASTAICSNQAFSFGRSLALQFHLEVDATLLERWLVGHVHELTAHRIDIRELRGVARRVAPLHRAAFERVFDDWLDASLSR